MPPADVSPPHELVAPASYRRAAVVSAADLVAEFHSGGEAIAAFYAGSADINVKLAVAVQRGDTKIAVELIGQGAEVNALIEGRLPLIHEASGRGYNDVVNALLASGRCDLTVRDFAGRLASEVADLAAHDMVLADRLAAEEIGQFREKNMDPRNPKNPDYGNWTWD
ncbi:MAG: hypothetical protein AB7K04_01870 [Pseudorhodoplanes sp.]